MVADACKRRWAVHRGEDRGRELSTHAHPPLPPRRVLALLFVQLLQNFPLPGTFLRWSLSTFPPLDLPLLFTVGAGFVATVSYLPGRDSSGRCHQQACRRYLARWGAVQLGTLVFCITLFWLSFSFCLPRLVAASSCFLFPVSCFFLISLF